MQIIPNAGLRADDVAERYFAWLDQSVPSVSVHRADERVELRVMGFRAPAIKLLRGSSDNESASFDVQGGFLVAAGGGGELRFEREDGDLRIALTGFRPLLPPVIYHATHALVHQLVMAAFCRSLRTHLLEDAIHG